MIVRFKDRSKERITKPHIGIVLFLISLLLMIITGPFGFLYGLLQTFCTRFIIGVGDYCMQMAIAMDQLGNVIMQHLFNHIFIKENGYKFGNADETISSVLGKNKANKTLSVFGEWIDFILDRIDPNHTLNSIDYSVDKKVKIK